MLRFPEELVSMRSLARQANYTRLEPHDVESFGDSIEILSNPHQNVILSPLCVGDKYPLINSIVLLISR